MPALSGDQHEIAFGDQRAVVVEVGGGLRTYAAGGLELLDGYGEDELCHSGRGQILAPWPNRLEDGSYEFDGQDHQLPIDEVWSHNAIHGLVRWASWTVAEHGPSRVVMAHTLHPRPGYPFMLALRAEYELGPGGLTMRTTATNIGADPCPFGAGAHPYLRLGTEVVDPLVLRVPASTLLLSDERRLPAGTTPVDGTEFDFREPRRIGGTKLDNAYADLLRDDDGLARVDLENEESGARVTLWADRSYPYLMVFTGDPLPDVNRRSIAVEPMTCPPNAFRSGDSLVRLAPGDSHVGRWGITASGLEH